MSNEKLAMSNEQRVMSMRLLAVFLLLCGLSMNAVAQQRGGDNEHGAVEITDARSTVTALGKQWAVFIAIDEYRERAPLFHPVRDAQEIKNILLEYYYIDNDAVRELYNRDATAAAIRRLFAELQEKTGPNDSVFIFHAGHGINDERTKTSAWIPYDGGEDRDEQAHWLYHNQILSMLDSLKARHVFLVSDSCYSGDLLDTMRGASEIIVNYPAAYDRISRQAMSSGASEEVADVSEFASRFKNALLRTESPYLTPDYLLSQIKEAQTTRPLLTIPILAAIPRSDHQLGGSFLFFRKNPRQEAAQPAPPVTQTVPPSSPVVVTPPLEPAPPVQAEPGKLEYFLGVWIATVEYNRSFDTYEIVFLANGRCVVKMINDTAEQEANGNWSWDGRYLKVSAVFRNAAITYQRNIDWISLVSFSGNNSFNVLAKPAASGSNIRFTFYRN